MNPKELLMSELYDCTKKANFYLSPFVPPLHEMERGNKRGRGRKQSSTYASGFILKRILNDLTKN